MTNQLARMVLTDVMRNKGSDIYSEIQIREALSMAINALEDEDKTCKTCRYKDCRAYDAFRRCTVPCDFCIRSVEGRLDMYVK